MESTQCGCLCEQVLTLSGLIRSSMAVPSARNSGLDRISNVTDASAQFLASTCKE